MDAVYILGSESVWDDNEIRLSLRSICANLVGIDNIFIIGKLPPFLDADIARHRKGGWDKSLNRLELQLIWIEHFDDFSLCKERRIMEKVKFACQHKAISDDFFFINDDMFLMSPLVASDMPDYYKGYLSVCANKRPHKDRYYNSLINCNNALAQRNYTTYNFDTHTPIIYNKKHFIEVMDSYDWNVKDGYTVKSLYANTIGLQGVHQKDCKIDQALDAVHICDKIKDRQFFSVGDAGVNEDMKQFLLDLFPKPSRWERDSTKII